MKTKKVVVGALSAAMLSLSVCSIAPVAVAANETVQISVGNATAEKAGEKFTVDVSLADVPAAGIQAIDFSIAFDNAVITIDEVKAGKITETGATGSDSTSAAAPLFDSYINNDEGYLCLAWSTSLDDASYWIKSDGVFCTISGTVSSNAKTNDKSDLKIVATDRETYPGSGVPNKTKVAKISMEEDRKIAELKMPDLNASSVEAAASMIAGTARSMGIVVED